MGPGWLRCFWSAALLPKRLEQHNCNRGREIQRARPVHWDRNTIVDIGREQSLRQPFRFATENEKIVFPKRRSIISALRLRSQEKISRLRRLYPLQVIEGIPQSGVYFIPIIQTGAFQLPIAQRKT